MNGPETFKVQKTEVKKDNILNAKTAQMLVEIISQMSLVRFQNHCPKLIFQVSAPEEHNESLILGEEMSFILIWEEYASIQFKCHYNIETVKLMCALNLDKSAEAINLAMVKDYMNEFCNLVGGYFRSILETNGHLMGMSLPFASSGSDEALYHQMRQSGFSHHKWAISAIDNDNNKDVTFFCSSEIKIMEEEPFIKCKEAFNKAIEADKKQEDNGDVDFL